MKRDAGGVFGKSFSLQGEERTHRFDCDHPGCDQKFWPIDPEWAAYSARAAGWVVDEHDDDAPMYCPIHREEGVTPPLVDDEVETKEAVRIEYRTPRAMSVIATIGFFIGSISISTLLLVWQYYSARVSLDEYRLTLQIEEDFTERSGIRRVDCNGSREPIRCVGWDASKRAVQYSCDKNHCQLESK